MIATLGNETERARLVKQLRTLIEVQHGELKTNGSALPDRVMTRFLLSLSEGVADICTTVYNTIAFLTDTPRLFAWIAQQASDEESRRRLLQIPVSSPSCSSAVTAQNLEEGRTPGDFGIPAVASRT